MVPPVRLYAPFQPQKNPSPHEGSITRSTLQQGINALSIGSSSLQTAAEIETLKEDETVKETAELLLSLNAKTC